MRGKIKKWAANRLRRIARWLDPPPPVEPVTPVEFIPSRDLAKIITDRNDSCIIFWGKVKQENDEYHIVGESIWKIGQAHVIPVMSHIYTDITGAKLED